MLPNCTLASIPLSQAVRGRPQVSSSRLLMVLAGRPLYKIAAELLILPVEPLSELKIVKVLNN